MSGDVEPIIALGEAFRFANALLPSPGVVLDARPDVSLVFQSADGRFNSGVWEAQRGKWRVVFTESEFCHLLAGVIVVTGDDGSQRTFRPGDAFACRLYRHLGNRRAREKALRIL